MVQVQLQAPQKITRNQNYHSDTVGVLGVSVSTLVQ